MGQRGFIVGCGRVAWQQDLSGTAGVIRNWCRGRWLLFSGGWWVVVGCGKVRRALRG